MSEVEFRPSTWAKSSTGVSTEATSFQTTATSVVSGMSMAELGSGEGGTLMDVAVNTIFPILLSAMTETIDGISEGLTDESAAMSDTGLAYEATEAANESEATAGTGV